MKYVPNGWKKNYIQNIIVFKDLDLDIARGFMFKGIKQNDYPVLFEIKALITQWHFCLDNENYSLYDYEKEILVNYGAVFLI